MKLDAFKVFLIFLICFALITIAGKVMAQGWLGPGGSTGGVIALIHVEGSITGGSGGSLLGETMASSVDLCSQLYEAAQDDSVKAVVLRVNSPGGSAAASDEIYRAIVSVKEHKPVVVSMGDVAASGGYYISSPASYIYANGSTLTGSIGVIFSLMNWEELANKVGLENNTLTAGEFKDIGSPWRDMTAEERRMLTELMTDVHDQFIKAVAEGRVNLDEEQVRELATGMIYTGSKAAEVGLVDEVGSLRNAIDKAAQLAGLDPDTPVEEYGTTSFLEELLGIESMSQTSLLGNPLTANTLVNLSQGLYLNSTLRDLVIR